MVVVKQIIKEFWVPTLVSLCWSLFNLYDGSNIDWSVVKFLNVFGPSFFITSWFTGQFFRIRKQTKVEHGLVSIKDQISSLLKSLESGIKDLINHSTGGESFCYLELSGLSSASNRANVVIVHQGEHSLYAVSARIVDLNILNEIQGELTFEKFGESQIFLNIGELSVGLAHLHPKIWDLGEKEIYKFNIFWTAKNGQFTQLLRYKKVNGRWLRATKVQRDEKILLEKVDEGLTNEHLDWS